MAAPSSSTVSSLSPQATSAGLVVIIGLLYCGCSAGLIAFNKYLIHEGRFPYAVPLVLFHTVVCSGLGLFLFAVKPSLFPSLTDPERKVKVDLELILKGALPISLAFSGQLALSNTALLHNSVAFLQMMKEANITLVYAMSLGVAIERFSWGTMRILLVVVFATALTIKGELHFSLSGFLIQGTSQLFESTRIVLQALLLSNAGKKLDALTYVLLVMPLCFLTMIGVVGGLAVFHPTPHSYLPTWAEVAHWWPMLLLNALVAFALNVVIALFVKHSSAVAFILAGLVKDAGIVLAGNLILREPISVLQGLGFGMQLLAIGVYTMAKTFPEKFEMGMLSGLNAVLFGLPRAATLKARLAEEVEEGKPSYGAVQKDTETRSS